MTDFQLKYMDKESEGIIKRDRIFKNSPYIQLLALHGTKDVEIH